MFNQNFRRCCLLLLSILVLSQLVVACSEQPQLLSNAAAISSPTSAQHISLEPAIDLASSTSSVKGEQTVVLAGGCFWGVEAVFEKLKGVTKVVSGYAGGTATTANYETVSSGNTGHAEAVKISYNPQQISVGQLLKIHFLIAHDPTEIDRQGPDTGKQYRSAIFFANAEQQRVAKAYVNQLNQARVFPKPIATQLVALNNFYAAEDYHQNFIDRNPNHPYVVVHDLPKIAQLRQQFPKMVKP
jgi:peptide-methionine (S)-S-oxide reductase